MYLNWSNYGNHLSSVLQDYVMHASGLDRFGSLTRRHSTAGGGSNEAREEFYSKVDCSLMKKVESFYREDFELFEYDSGLFFNLCQK